jgi:hypothetical protein
MCQRVILTTSPKRYKSPIFLFPAHKVIRVSKEIPVPPVILGLVPKEIQEVKVTQGLPETQVLLLL